MNKVLETTLNVASEIFGDTLDFNDIYSELTSELSIKSNFLNENMISENESESESDIESEEALTEMIMQYTITNSTIAMMKQHEQAMKELLDE